MRGTVLLLVLSLLPLTMVRNLRAAEVPRDEYLKLVPLSHPRLVPQTDASEALHLYGDREDPAYRDEEPRDGIDDRRHEILMALAVRFAPYLAQNTSEFPTNFEVYIENADSFPLYIDTWDVTSAEPDLIESRTIDFARLAQVECPRRAEEKLGGAAPLADVVEAGEDCKLVELLDRFVPGGSLERSCGDRFVRSRPELFDVLFFNFPGEGPETWGQCYEPMYETSSAKLRRVFPHAYVHPFLASVAADDGETLGYELILQYWFFYPSNDSGMNHEGDWEHLNVVIAPRSMVEGPLSAETIERVLEGALSVSEEAPDPLVIQRLDYYFHHCVMTLDFATPNVYRPRDQWRAQIKSLPAVRFQQAEIWKGIRRMAYADDGETVVNTHPFGFIGADNKGLDQLLAGPGGKNRNPHGTFPFPGRYNNVGPGGTTDQISVHVDPRRYWKRLAAGRASAGPEFRRGSVLGLADSDRLRIVPDWERVADLTRRDPGVRRDWSWLVLPLRWGYPATRSPFTGILPHFDTGNLSILGPAYNGGWNVSGAAPGFSVYEPHLLPAVFPLSAQDSFRNDLGFLNVGLVFLSLPPLDFTARIASYPFKVAFGRHDPVFYPKESVPYRFVGISSGVSIQALDDDFKVMALNLQQFDEFAFRILLHMLANGADSTTVSIGGGEFLDDAVGPFFQIPFYVGRRFASENTVRNVHSTFGVNVDFNNIPSYRYSAEINLWEYAGSVRYGLTPTRLQPYLKAGYGWTWLRLENVQANGVPFSPATTDWIKPESIWPNVWHFGVGIEYVPWKRIGKFAGGAEIALRFEYARYVHDLGLDLTSISLDKLDLFFDTLGDVPGGDSVTRDDFLFGLTVSF